MEREGVNVVLHERDEALSDADAASVVHEATRALLWLESAADGRHLVTSVVRALGGVLEPAVSAGLDAITIDVSCGDGVPTRAIVGGLESLQPHLDAAGDEPGRLGRLGISFLAGRTAPPVT